MKSIIVFLWAFFCMSEALLAQGNNSSYRSDLPDVLVMKGVSLHFLSPEPITYVDISTHAVKGDLPVKNVLRLKIVPDSLLKNGYVALVTIIGESFIAQYNLRYVEGVAQSNIPAMVDIMQEHIRPLDVPGITLTNREMQGHASRILNGSNAKSIRNSKAYGLYAKLNQVYTAGNYIFLDIAYENQTNLPYEIDEMRFKIEDKKINKATNSQSVEIIPVWQLYPSTQFKKRYRNIYVLKKATFPGNKVLNIELSEKQISGRTIALRIKYSDILEADAL